MAFMKNETSSCRCLNVRFYVDSLSPASDNLISSVDDRVLVHLNDGKGLRVMNDDFGVISSSGGAQLSVPSLLTSRTVNDWRLFSCFNCKTLTHAVNSATNNTLVNCEMLIGAAEQRSLVCGPNYFPLYGIVLHSNTEPISKSSLKPSVVNTVRQIKDDTEEYIRNEEQLMLERIEDFEASEKAKFDSLKQTANKQEKTLEQLVYAAFREGNDDVDSAFERSEEEIRDLSISKPTREGHSNTRSDSVVDDVFDLDPFSDGEGDAQLDLEEDDELPNYLTRTGGKGDSKTMAAKSMPIQVPRDLRRSVAASFSDEDETPDPQNMQASIRALAQSIGGDGTEMFGDLPRHRYNSRHF